MRYKHYGFLIYPDISPDNWRAFCYRFFTKVYISDLHTNSNNYHYHVLLEFDKLVHIQRVIQLLGPVNAVGLCPIFHYKQYLKNYDCKLLGCIGLDSKESM